MTILNTWMPRAGTAIFSLLLLWMTSVQGLSPAYAQATSAAADAEAGKAIYDRSCMSCHGADGRGGRMAGMLSTKPRNLADPTYMGSRSDDQLFKTIKQGGASQGLSNAMPGFANQLTDAQLNDTLAYVRTLAATQPAPSSSTTAAPATAKPSVPSTSAPGAIGIARLRLSIWPEYDDPRVLILIRGEVTPDSPLPAKLQLPMPKGAELIGTGMISEQNTLINHPHQLIPGETHDVLELTLPVTRFFVEWYHNPYRTTDREAEKQFTYALNLPYPIKQLDVDILKPTEATDFRTDPAADQQATNNQGGTFHQFSYSEVKAGESTAFTVTYVKTTDQPSVQKQQPDAISPLPQADGGKTTVAFAILAGVIALYASGFVLWRNYQHRHPPAPAATAPVQTIVLPTEQLTKPAPTANFCSGCGRQRQPGDAFCSGCGQSLSSP